MSEVQRKYDGSVDVLSVSWTGGRSFGWSITVNLCNWDTKKSYIMSIGSLHRVMTVRKLEIITRNFAQICPYYNNNVDCQRARKTYRNSFIENMIIKTCIDVT